MSKLDIKRLKVKKFPYGKYTCKFTIPFKDPKNELWFPDIGEKTDLEHLYALNKYIENLVMSSLESGIDLKFVSKYLTKQERKKIKNHGDAFLYYDNISTPDFFDVYIENIEALLYWKILNPQMIISRIYQLELV